MRFSKISITKKGVHLIRTTKDENGAVEEIDLESPERPLPSFADALQGFKPYVIELFDGVLEVKEDTLSVTTLSLSEDKHGHRGLIVTATVPVPKAYDKPVVLNTPLVREGGENASAEAFVLADEVLELIRLAEEEATRYVNHERMQLELMPAAAKSESANANAFKERAAAASSAATRKPSRERGTRKGRKSTTTAAPGEVWNPESDKPPCTTAELRQLCLSVERDVAEDAIERWTATERARVQRWCEMRQQELLGTLQSTKMPNEPECLLADATKTLADGWTDPKPGRVDDAGVRSIQSAASASEHHTPRHIQ